MYWAKSGAASAATRTCGRSASFTPGSRTKAIRKPGMVYRRVGLGVGLGVGMASRAKAPLGAGAERARGEGHVDLAVGALPQAEADELRPRERTFLEVNLGLGDEVLGAVLAGNEMDLGCS